MSSFIMVLCSCTAASYSFDETGSNPVTFNISTWSWISDKYRTLMIKANALHVTIMGIIIIGTLKASNRAITSDIESQ